LYIVFIILKRKKGRLNPHHSFFVIVNNGEDDEIEYRCKLEKYLTYHYEIPGLLIVVGGGKDTFKSVLFAINDKVPIILVAVSKTNKFNNI